MTKKPISYLCVFLVLVTLFVTFTPQIAETADLTGEYNGRYNLSMDKKQLTLISNGKVVLETAYKIARRTGITSIIPEQDWYIDDSLHDISMYLQNGIVIIKEGSLYYPLKKGGNKNE